MNAIIDIIAANKAGQARGIYSICSAHPLVIDAALQQAKQDGSPLLIEATANQVNQFGGYTGMTPAQFIAFICQRAEQQQFPHQQLIFGGDHLGPVCWKSDNADAAMSKAKDMIAAYVAAGFKKIHLDASMACGDDAEPLADERIADRAAQLCAVAERTAMNLFGHSDLLYVIGTEVPAPGGVSTLEQHLHVTSVAHVEQTLALHKTAFVRHGLSTELWSRVIGIVVQPGVEFDNDSVHAYDAKKTTALSHFITTQPAIAYEAHSTDYQRDGALKELVRDHFAILKVGPQLTFALREALYALSHIEEQLCDATSHSRLRDVCAQRMRQQPRHWQAFYRDQDKAALHCHYSYSDRIRYYWNDTDVAQAVAALLRNLDEQPLPRTLISQFLPQQYEAMVNQDLPGTAATLIRHKIMQVTAKYAAACFQQ